MDDPEKLLADLLANGGLDATAPLQGYSNTVPTVAEQLRLHHPVAAAAAFATLLFDPQMQGSALRLESLVHMSLAYGGAIRAPSADLLTKAFADLGTGSLAHGESDADQLFVGLVRTSRGGFRVLEGNWTAQSFHLQRIINLIEKMPTGAHFDALREAVFALLALSDRVCDRAGLARYAAGQFEPLETLPPEAAAWAIGNPGLVTFDADDLAALGVDSKDLEPFVLDQEFADELLAHEWGDTPLEACPLVETREGFHLLLPTAVSLSIRQFVISQLLGWGFKAQLAGALGAEYVSWFGTLRTVGSRLASQMRFKFGAFGGAAAIGQQLDQGRFVQILLLLDDLEGFENDRFIRPRVNTGEVDKLVQTFVGMAHKHATDSGDYREGLTLVVACGIGRPAFGPAPENLPDGWRVEMISAPDLETLTRLRNFDLLRLWRLLEARDEMEAQGARFFLEGGLAQLVGQARGLEGHLLDHGGLEDGCLDEGGPLVIFGDPYALLRIRHEAARNWDPHVTRDIEGRAIWVTRESLPIFDEDRELQIFIEEGLPLRGVFETERRSWWWRIENNSESVTALHYRWQTLATWMARAAPVLEERFPALPEGALEWRAKFDADLAATRTDLSVISLDQARACLTASADAEARILRTHATEDYEKAFSAAENIAEQALVETLVKAAAMAVSHDLAEAELNEIVAQIVPDPLARQTHAIRRLDFRDYVRGSLEGSATRIELEDDAALRVGVGWKVREREAGAWIDGKADCGAYLNGLVTRLQNDLIDDLRQFDRRGLIGAILLNHERAAREAEELKRTAAANLTLHDDKAAVMRKLVDRESKLTAVFLTCRLLLEMSACECPTSGGRRPGKLDLARLMGRTSQIFHFGGDSDAIRLDAMPPQIRITPLGDVHANRQFADAILEPYGRRNADVRFEDASESYADHVEPQEPRPAGPPQIDPTFAAAVEETIGASIIDVWIFIEFLEDLGMDAGQAVLFMKRSQLLAVKTDSGTLDQARARTVIDALTFLATPSWREAPAGYSAADRHIWRFRRRLSVLRRPLIPLDDSDDPILAISPGLARQAWVYLLSNYRRGDFPEAHLGPKLASWKKKQADLRGRAFAQKVAKALAAAGWQTHCEVKMTKLLKRGFDHDYGDVDVLAYHPISGRVAMIECKDLQYGKTYAEVAGQLAGFRGGLNEKGKPDYLRRHLDRMDLARANLDAVGQFLGLAALDKVESHLVFHNPVPMKYALQRMEDQVAVTIFDELDRF